jgi:hypothetical protein
VKVRQSRLGRRDVRAYSAHRTVGRATESDGSD